MKNLFFIIFILLSFITTSQTVIYTVTKADYSDGPGSMIVELQNALHDVELGKNVIVNLNAPDLIKSDPGTTLNNTRFGLVCSGTGSLTIQKDPSLPATNKQGFTYFLYNPSSIAVGLWLMRNSPTNALKFSNLIFSNFPEVTTSFGGPLYNFEVSDCEFIDNNVAFNFQLTNNIVITRNKYYAINQPYLTYFLDGIVSDVSNVNLTFTNNYINNSIYGITFETPQVVTPLADPHATISISTNTFENTGAASSISWKLHTVNNTYNYSNMNLTITNNKFSNSITALEIWNPLKNMIINNNSFLNSTTDIQFLMYNNSGGTITTTNYGVDLIGTNSLGLAVKNNNSFLGSSKPDFSSFNISSFVGGVYLSQGINIIGQTLPGKIGVSLVSNVNIKENKINTNVTNGPILLANGGNSDIASPIITSANFVTPFSINVNYQLSGNQYSTTSAPFDIEFYRSDTNGNLLNFLSRQRTSTSGSGVNQNFLVNLPSGVSFQSNDKLALLATSIGTVSGATPKGTSAATYSVINTNTVGLSLCAGCTSVISTNSSANITINSGQVLCIASGITYSGNITLNGGTICNQGTVTNITFNTGTLNNYSVFSRTGAVNVNSTGNVTINNFGGSKFLVSGAFNFAANNAAYNLNLNVYKDAQYDVKGAVNSSKGNLLVNVGLDGSFGSQNLALFNVGGQFNVSSSALNFSNGAGGYVNLNGSVNLTDKLSKTIINNGSFNINNSINIAGNAQNVAQTIITNNGAFNVSNSINTSLNNGTLTLINNQSLNIGQSITIDKNNNNIVNNRILNVGLDLNIQLGAVVNNGTLTVNRDVDVSKGVYTNNNVTIAKRDMVTDNNQAIINNNGYLSIARTFNNDNATVNIGQRSLIQTVNYINNNPGTINGPVSVPDTASYAKIIISGSSNNTGYINGRVIIHDQSLIGTTNNNGFGFDQISNSSRIANAVIFATRSIGPFSPIAINCSLLTGLYLVQVTGPSVPIGCGGPPTNLTAQLSLFTFLPAGPFLIPTYVPITSPPVIYTWQPGNITGQSILVTPLTTQNYNVTANWGGCLFTNVITVVVTSPLNFIASAGGSEIVFPYPDFVNLTGSVISGGLAPFSYAWTPNMFFSSAGNVIINPQVNPPVGLNYTLTVTDANGCNTTATVNVIPLPYAHLNKIPDGGYYKVVNNKLLFKFDGQYAQTGLNYKVLDKTNNVIASNLSGNIANGLVVNSGDNRYFLDVSSSGINNGYYTLEVTNEKKEKLYLRFQK